MTGSFEHIPVMAREVEALLDLKPGGVHLDCTLGLGGHALRACQYLGADGRLIGIDQDSQALAIAREKLKAAGCRVDIVKSNFAGLSAVLDSFGLAVTDSVFFDLGVSSLQFDDGTRGFSFREDAPLDMRMDADGPTTAADLLNGLGEQALADIIFRYGEERFSRRIAAAVVRARTLAPIRTTGQLSDLILRSLPKGYTRGSIHPATRTFQALRIAVNREMDVLAEALEDAFLRLKPGGRLCVIAFHSLEDRIVKEMFRELARAGRARLLTKKPLMSGDDEAQANPRARSARVRGLERIE